MTAAGARFLDTMSSLRERIVERLKRRATDRRGQLGFMGIASFLESTLVPIPLETILVPYYQTHREAVWRTALVVTLGCLAGAGLFYLVGVLAMDGWGRTLIEAVSSPEQFERVRAELQAHGFLLILLVGVTPIPFQVAMLAAGATGYPFGWFMLAATLARGLRYYGLAALVLRFGDDAMRLWKENRLKASLAAITVLLAVYGVARWAGQAVMG